MIAVLFVICLIVCGWHVWSEHSDDNIRIPIELHDPTGKIQTQYFEFGNTELRLEFAVANFCESFQIKKSSCRSLYKIAKEKQKGKQSEFRNVVSINKQFEHPVDVNVNEGLLKHPRIIRAELSMYSTLINNGQISMDSSRESEVLDNIISSLQPLSLAKTERIILIHSLTLDPVFDESDGSSSSSNSILSSILSRLHATSGLLKSVRRIIVLNYGYLVSSKLQQSYPSVEFIQFSSDVSLLELPTLQVLQQLSKILVDNSLGNTQLLLLSTLGEEYSKPYQSVSDWREMLLYFLVEEHQSAYHLLASSEFDAVAVNYHIDQTAMLPFFWVTARHVARLPLALLPRDGDRTSSVLSDVGKWLSSAVQSRIFVTHSVSSTVKPLLSVYPAYCYRRDLLKTLKSNSSGSISITGGSGEYDGVTEAHFKQVCGFDPPTAATTATVGDSNCDESSGGECGYYSSLGVGSRRSYAKCMGLEVNCNSE